MPTALAFVRVYTNLPTVCTRCGRDCAACVVELSNGQLYGDDCAAILTGHSRWRTFGNSAGAHAKPSTSNPAVNLTPRPVKPRTMIAKFGGKCSCGARFAAGSEIVYRDGGVEGCTGCNFGAAPASDYLGVYAEMTAAYAAIDAHLKGERRVSPREFGALQARHNAAMSRWCRLTPAQAEESKAAA